MTGYRGSVSVDCRRRVVGRDGPQCRYCGRRVYYQAPWWDRGVELTFDHVHPASLGGSNRAHNVVIACRRCNVTKGDSLPTGCWQPLPRPATLLVRRSYPPSPWPPSRLVDSSEDIA